MSSITIRFAQMLCTFCWLYVSATHVAAQGILTAEDGLLTGPSIPVTADVSLTVVNEADENFMVLGIAAQNKRLSSHDGQVNVLLPDPSIIEAIPDEEIDAFAASLVPSQMEDVIAYDPLDIILQQTPFTVDFQSESQVTSLEHIELATTDFVLNYYESIFGITTELQTSKRAVARPLSGSLSGGTTEYGPLTKLVKFAKKVAKFLTSKPVKKKAKDLANDAASAAAKAAGAAAAAGAGALAYKCFVKTGQIGPCNCPCCVNPESCGAGGGSQGGSGN